MYIRVLTERVILTADGLCIARIKLAGTRSGNKCASYHEAPLPTPTTEMGVQVIPTGMFTSWRTTPTVARRAETPGAPAF